MAVYVCGKCNLLFQRVGEVNVCEGCGHINIRLANEQETAEYERRKAERDTNARSERAPDKTYHG